MDANHYLLKSIANDEGKLDTISFFDVDSKTSKVLRST